MRHCTSTRIRVARHPDLRGRQHVDIGEHVVGTRAIGRLLRSDGATVAMARAKTLSRRADMAAAATIYASAAPSLPPLTASRTACPPVAIWLMGLSENPDATLGAVRDPRPASPSDRRHPSEEPPGEIDAHDRAALVAGEEAA
jgi:hypothetical protein